jgi:hypothetical protein
MMHRFFTGGREQLRQLPVTFNALFIPVRRACHTDAFQKMMQTFNSISSLHFTSENAFYSSPLNRRLKHIFSEKYSLHSSSRGLLQTISMQETLALLGLDVFYRSYIERNKYFLGVHGSSHTSLSAIFPRLQGVKKMGTSHNPYHDSAAQVLFFYGNNIQMMMHYSEINSIVTDRVDGNSDPHYHPARIGVLGFADQTVIDKAQSRKITIMPTLASIKKSHDKSPEDYVIGTEIQLPQTDHAKTFNLPIFSIKGSPRLFPLDSGNQYSDGKLCHWEKGRGYFVDEEEAKPLRFNHSSI